MKHVLTTLAALFLALPTWAAGLTGTFPSIDGGTLAIEDWRGRPVLVVNTASQCGFTRQYAELQAVWEGYRDRGLVVLGVPSNDFGGQEPGTEEEIKTFCEVNFDVDFPMTSKVHVKGDDVHPFYEWAAGQVGMAGVPRWNFHKILIGHDGRFLGGYGSNVEPEAPRIRRAVEDALGAAKAVSG